MLENRLRHMFRRLHEGGAPWSYGAAEFGAWLEREYVPDRPKHPTSDKARARRAALTAALTARGADAVALLVRCEEVPDHFPGGDTHHWVKVTN